MNLKPFVIYSSGFPFPQPIFKCHRVDERDDLWRDARWGWFHFGLVSPKQAKTLPMPAEKCVGLDNEQRVPPRPLSADEHDEESTIQGGERKA